MTGVEITGSTLKVYVKGIHKLLALKNRLEVPLENVVDIEWDPQTAYKE